MKGITVIMEKKKLLIVESPAKAQTIKKYLGSGFNVVASMGHIIDLPKSQMGVDVENDFEPKYITIRGKGSLLTQLKKEAAKASKVYLATDPDREGEAISWHLKKALNIKEDKCRVTFNEITKSAVKAAMSEPREIDMNLVDAQQARRVLDRIVGYSISPLLWQKVKRGLSAGRVQSVAVRLICDREEEIINFVPEEYWTIEAELTSADKKAFSAKYFGENGKENKLSNENEAKKIADDVKDASFTVEEVKKIKTKRNPQPPFTTSTLQQDASRKLNFSAIKTMQVAQALYEGVDLGGKIGTVGLITYMRTDSLRISKEAQAEALSYLSESFEKEYLQPREFKTKKGAQDAHEAIRPTSVNIVPKNIKDKLTNDQYKLYKLIWERFLASQMSAAVYDTVQVNLDAKGHTFRANGSSLAFSGYMAIYVEGSDTKAEKTKALPKLEENTTARLKSIERLQHFTQPPARFTEASLVKELEENGIGRPSTYAPTIATIISRGYIVRSKKQLMPTELGNVTTDIMRNYFSNIVDVEFTAGMEQKLDLIDGGGLKWKSVLYDFYPEFAKTLKTATEKIEKITIKDEESDVVCDKCGRKMVYKLGKFGRFLACPGYPECQNTMTIKIGTGAKCPKCGGEILVKKSRKGKVYYACENRPKCDFMAWDEPQKETCPKCGQTLFRKYGKGAKIYCMNEKCAYSEPVKKNKR